MTEPLPTPSSPERESIMIAAFEGWNDAGNAASHAIDHLARVWNAQEYGALDPEDYHDFQVNRPTISLLPNGERCAPPP